MKLFFTGIICFAFGMLCLSLVYRTMPSKIGNKNNLTLREHEWIGRKEAFFTIQFGAPISDVNGYVPLGQHTPESLPIGEIRSLQYKDSRGIIFVWLEKRNNHWGCFDSAWVKTEAIGTVD